MAKNETNDAVLTYDAAKPLINWLARHDLLYIRNAMKDVQKIPVTDPRRAEARRLVLGLVESAVLAYMLAEDRHFASVENSDRYAVEAQTSHRRDVQKTWGKFGGDDTEELAQFFRECGIGQLSAMDPANGRSTGLPWKGQADLVPCLLLGTGMAGIAVHTDAAGAFSKAWQLPSTLSWRAATFTCWIFTDPAGVHLRGERCLAAGPWSPVGNTQYLNAPVQVALPVGPGFKWLTPPKSALPKDGDRLPLLPSELKSVLSELRGVTAPALVDRILVEA